MSISFTWRTATVVTIRPTVPHTIHTIRPASSEGEKSPKPTEVTVIDTKYSASKKDHLSPTAYEPAHSGVGAINMMASAKRERRRRSECNTSSRRASNAKWDAPCALPWRYVPISVHIKADERTKTM